MKGLVVGCGSIGKRHLQNLKLLGVSELGVVESDKQRIESVTAESGARAFVELESGLTWSPDFVVIATPPALHLSQSIQAASSGCAVFIEKPLSHTSSGIAELLRIIDQRSLVSMVGCNMRFHPGPAKIKEILDKKLLGKIVSARIHVGSYLPAWRPGTDYRTNYAAREEMGGGCILDCIHEIDLARWYLGDVVDVSCTAGHFSSLEIATEDVAVIVSRHAAGALSEVHLDYVQRTYERGCQIAGENGSLFWDFRGKQVRWYDATSDHWTHYDQPGDWQLNQMYLDEMRHFLECIAMKRQTLAPVSDMAAVMEIVFAAKNSAREGRRMMIAVGGGAAV